MLLDSFEADAFFVLFFCLEKKHICDERRAPLRAAAAHLTHGQSATAQGEQPVKSRKRPESRPFRLHTQRCKKGALCALRRRGTPLSAGGRLRMQGSAQGFLRGRARRQQPALSHREKGASKPVSNLLRSFLLTRREFLYYTKIACLISCACPVSGTSKWSPRPLLRPVGKCCTNYWPPSEPAA